MRFASLFTGIVGTFVLFTSTVIAQSIPERTACSSQIGRDRERCESRNNRRLLQGSSNRIVRSRAIQDSHMMSRTQLRAEERRKRNILNTKSLSHRGPTVRMLPATNDVNTSRIQYLQAYRADQLACMEETPGRPRRLCFERIRNDVKQAMKEARGTWLQKRRE